MKSEGIHLMCIEPSRRLTKPRPISDSQEDILEAVPAHIKQRNELSVSLPQTIDSVREAEKERGQKFNLKPNFRISFRCKYKSTNASPNLTSDIAGAGFTVPDPGNLAKRNIDVPWIKEASQRREINAKRLQKIELWDRIKWAAKDQQALEKMIASIQKGNDELRKLSKLRPLKDSTVLLRKLQESEARSKLEEKIITSLAYISESLKYINHRRKGYQPFFLSI